MRASYSRIEPGGVYLIDNSQTLLLWLHASVSPNLLADLFGPTYTTLSSLDPFMSTLPVLETHLNCQVRNILRWLEGVRGSKGLTINVARQGVDGSEYEFARRLVEDRNSEAQSYVDWLVSVHRFIQLEVSLSFPPFSKGPCGRVRRMGMNALLEEWWGSVTDSVAGPMW